MKYLLVNVDTNDGDYIEKMSPVTDEQLAILKPLFHAIGQFKPYTTEKWKYGHGHNFPYGEVCREELGEKTPEELYPEHKEAVELFQDDFIPHAEYGFHTICNVKVLTITEIQELI